MQRLDDGRPDLPRTDDDDLHAAAEPTPPDTLGTRCVGFLALGMLAAATAAGVSLAAPSASPKLVAVARGLSSPVDVVQAPGEPTRLYVVEQPGVIRVVERGRVQPTPFLDVRSLVVAGGEQGLLGLAFSPGYARDRTFYVNYTAKGDGSTRIVRYRAANGRALPGSAQELLRVAQPYANHNGGNLEFGPDGKLWVGLGDGGGGGDPDKRAQNPDMLLGKMFRLDVRQASPTPESGHRPPQPLALQLRPGDGRSLDRRRRAEQDRGGRPAAEPRHEGVVNFGWNVTRGAPLLRPEPVRAS